MTKYNYFSAPSSAETALCDWTFESLADCSSKVIPDGCRDLIWIETHDDGLTFFISELSQSAYFVDFKADERAGGIRIKPGTTIDTTQLYKWLETNPVSDLVGNDGLDEFCTRSPAVTEALSCLGSGLPSVQASAIELGVSIRTLQRLIKRETHKCPQFWYSLSKARRAGRSLNDYAQLSEVAYCMGYADQAHLTREMNRWFGETPKQLRDNRELVKQLCEPGYG